MVPDTATKGAGSLRKALSLLDVVKRRSEGISLPDLARATGIARPTIYRMVAALVEEGFLRQSDSTKAVSLGPKLLELAQAVWRDTDLRDTARGELAELRAKTEATALLMVRSDRVATCIELAPSDTGGIWQIGEALPVTACAGGIAMLAYGDWGRLDAELEALGVIAPREFKSWLGVTRSRFYAIDNDPLSGGRRGVASPIFDFSGAPIAAVCLYGNGSQDLHDLGAAVVQAARQISRRRGGYPFGIEVPVAGIRQDHPNVSCLADARCLIGDSPVIDDAHLLWIDILTPAVLSLNETTGALLRMPCSEVVGSLIDCGDGDFLVAQQTRLSMIRADGTETWQRAAPGLPAGFRYNDGARDAHGRVWLGVMDMATSRGTGLLHRYDTLDAEPVTLPGFSLPNGIVFSQARDEMLVVDSMERRLVRFRYDLATGEVQLEDKVPLLVDGEGRPSGLATGPDGTFFTCHWDGAEVVQLDSRGHQVANFQLPVARPSGVTYEPARNRLIVTSARVRLSDTDLEASPLSGATFEVRLDTAGRAN